MKKLTLKVFTLVIAISIAGCGGKTNAPKDQQSILPTPIIQKEIEKIRPEVAEEKKVTVHFIDVGQGDCEFVELPNGDSMLIDAGNFEDGDEVTEYIQALGYDTIDYVLATHPHSDHIGGMAEVLDNFEVEVMYMPRIEHTTKTFENMLNMVEKKSIALYSAKSGVHILNQDDLNIDLLAPIGSVYSNLNNYSAVCRIEHGETSFLFMGDAESEVESEILSNGAIINSDFLKVGHHGSDSSSTDLFIKKVIPKAAVISCGKENSYGHPDRKTIDTLKSIGAEIYRTDESGTVIVTADSHEKFEINKKASSVKENAPPAVTNDTSDNSSENVYVTNTGHKFHKDGCTYLSKSKIKILKSEAISKGYEPCKRCFK